MLNRPTKIYLFVACALIASPAAGQTQFGNQAQNPGAANQQARQQQYTTPQLTPEQTASMQRAALEAPAQQQPIQQPAGFPLPAEQVKYVDELLDYWEQNSKRVEKYKCDFRRFEYDSEIVAWRDPNTNNLAAHKVAFGEIRFASPDRGRYETTKVLQFVKPPQQPGGTAEYKEAEEEGVHERWICDGKSIYEFDFASKRIYEMELPPEMRGDVSASPLPFLFGGDKKQILERYWVRPASPEGVENEYWLELFPKRAEDARTYSKIELVIAKEDFLPKAMHLYSPQYDPAKGNYASRYFTFENRVVNSQLIKIQDFFGNFVRPRKPILGGWEWVNRQVIQNQAAVMPGAVLPAGAGRR